MAIAAGAAAAIALAAGGACQDGPEQARASPTAEAGVPSLVVVIVIDQLRYDLLERYRPHFSKGGFLRFLDEGARFTNARYLHGTTDTCPGHAVIATGTWGADNGIIANQWHDGGAEPGTGCAAQDRKEFERHLLRPTIGDVMGEGFGPDAKVFAASSKNAAAQLLGGAAADGVFWPGRDGRYTTWKDGDARLPVWLRAFNAGGGIEAYARRPWERLLPASDYAFLGPDDEPAEHRPGMPPATFPHDLDGSDARAGSSMGPQDTPFADELLAKLGLEIIRAEGLGDDAVPDYLALSFSASDVVGHAFGPDSQESMDTIVRLDRQLEKLLDFIDRRVRLDRALVVLTADHGVGRLPEVAQRHAWGAGAGRISETAMNEAVEQALAAPFGRSPVGKWIAFHDFPNIYLREDALRARGIALPAAETVARDAVAAFPGVRRAITRTELVHLKQSGGGSPVDEVLLRSFRPERSGHVVYQVEAYQVVAEPGSSNHGSDWDYDTHVPLMWLGPGVRSGDYPGAVTPADVAPTIFALLGLRDPGSSGRALREMFASDGQDATTGR
jgi:arylsulfatase A-like enzyme